MNRPEVGTPSQPTPGAVPTGTADVTAEPRPFDRLTWTTGLVLAALGLTLALDVVAVVSDVSYHRLVDQIAGGDIPSISKAQDADNRQQTIAQVQLALVVATAVLFIIWFHRAYRNLGALGVVRLRWGTGWAVGAWFVPFLNLVRPKAIANDTWRGSDPELQPEIDEPAGGVPWFHTLWWAAFIADGIFGRVAARYFADAQSASELSSATALLIVSDSLDIFACLLAIAVVAATTARQRKRAGRLTGHALLETVPA